eukprot:TRINITY_DN2883_c0_g1_i2.p1 TRINITY_DN2883_c0_g1~~TRINITY_DN2883_c0_g1_i2.p1  ORF type:complete len:599 (-),score=119.89 TRINITY_DN2883_c0_g1_i2:41-1837(-)
MAGAEFDYLGFFKEEIMNDNPTIKIGAVNNLHLIASALGPQKTVSELIPYVTQVVQEEPLKNDDEFLYSMAKQYAVLSDYINGQDDLLIAPLEHLAAQEETVIRDQAIQSLFKIIEKRPSLAPDYLVPTLHRLATKTDFFMARISACGLLPLAYRHVKEDHKAGLRKAFNTLCADETPMVRRAAAHKMKDFFEVCSKQDVLTDLITVYKQLSQEDTQDTIRVASVHASLVLAKMLNADENRQHTVQVMKEAATDRSWRVRLTVAKKFDELCKAFGPELTNQVLMEDCLIKLLKDSEQEVRKEAVKVIEICLTKLPEPLSSEQVQQHILPQFQSLGLDSAQTVRAALAQVLGPIAKALGSKLTQQHLLSLITDLLKDDFHDVRLNMVSHAGLICEVLASESLCVSLMQTITNLVIDNHWRIRQSVVEQIPALARLLGKDFFESKLESIVLSSLRDSVHSVRQAAIQKIEEIAQVFSKDPSVKSNWTVDHLLPKLVEQYSTSTGYANRVTTLHVLPQVSSVMSQDQVAQYVLPLVVRATKDSVPNVRFCACSTLTAIINSKKISPQHMSSEVRKVLLELEHDSDIDVQYYAQQALQTCPA